MDFLGDTTHHDYKAMSPAWPAELNAVDATYAAHMRNKISNDVLAIELEQDRMRSLFPAYTKMKWDGASSDEVSAKEAERKETSGKLKTLIQRFEALLAEWDEKMVSVEVKGEKRKRTPAEEIEEINEDDWAEFEEGSRPPPASKLKTFRSYQAPPDTIPLPVVQNRFKNIRSIDPKTISVGDIGWAPLPRMSQDVSAKKNIPSEYGSVNMKVCPFIIVKKFDDCMLGLVISSAGGNGLKHKEMAVRARSTYVTGSHFKGFDLPQYGWDMAPRYQNLVVQGTGYEPAQGSFVDMFDTHKIYYNTRFEKKGCLTRQSIANLGRMRLSALLWGSSES